MSKQEKKLMHTDLQEYFSYNPLSGKISWLKEYYGNKIGEIAGYHSKVGYLTIRFKKKVYYAHRLAWFLYYNEWPKDKLDHINGTRDDNRIDNLRIATHSQNLHNMKMRPNNTSGVKGVYWNKQKRKWQAQIGFSGMTKNLGRFDSLDEAEQVMRKAREELHGEFANHGS